MDGQTDERREEWTDRWTDRWMDNQDESLFILLSTMAEFIGVYA
jgi:hypothetical protein